MKLKARGRSSLCYGECWSPVAGSATGFTCIVESFILARKAVSERCGNALPIPPLLLLRPGSTDFGH